MMGGDSSIPPSLVDENASGVTLAPGTVEAVVLAGLQVPEEYTAAGACTA
jgi:hypothetical protein